MERQLTDREKKQIDYLQNRKMELIDNLMGACEEINAQIKEVKNGNWLRCVEKWGVKK